MTVAARHPRDLARHRAGASRAWRQAALIAAPIVFAITTLAFAAWQFLGAGSAAARVPAAVVQRSSIAPARTPAAFTGAAPGAGTTGTIALPPEPVAAVIAPVPAAAARPFSTVHASAQDRGRALDCLATAIYYEAASEPDDGQRAVAQVVLNRVRHSAFPATVCGVVYQGSEKVVCQFSFACDGAMARTPSRSGWARAVRVAGAALSGYVFAPVGLATHYHTYAVTPAWNRTLVMTDAIGAHFFHRWKGYWGTGAAFTRAYRGGEPVPGPHARIAPALTPALAPMQIAMAKPVAAPVPVTPPSAIQAEHVESGAPLTPVLTADAQVLDRWKDSGKPLR